MIGTTLHDPSTINGRSPYTSLFSAKIRDIFDVPDQKACILQRFLTDLPILTNGFCIVVGIRGPVMLREVKPEQVRRDCCLKFELKRILIFRMIRPGSIHIS
jgi:hypothetical protein